MNESCLVAFSGICAAMSRGASTVRIAFLGDIHVGQVTELTLSKSLQGMLAAADFVVANMESPITKRPAKATGKITLSSCPESADILRAWGVNVVSLANNHIFDSGKAGFDDTRSALQDLGIQCFGAGDNLAEACQPLCLTHSKKRVAILGCSEGKTESRSASADSYGCAPLDRKQLRRQIQDLCREYDGIIVQPHWGFCDYSLPSPQQLLIASELTEAGATAVIGHHSHVVQGISLTKTSVIAYSLGNFAFVEYDSRGHPSKLTKENNQGVVLFFTLTDQKMVKVDLVHTLRRGSRVEIQESPLRERTIQKRCEQLKHENYRLCWQRAVGFRLMRRALYWSNPFRWPRLNRDQLRGFGWMLKGIFCSGVK